MVKDEGGARKGYRVWVKKDGNTLKVCGPPEIAEFFAPINEFVEGYPKEAHQQAARAVKVVFSNWLAGEIGPERADTQVRAVAKRYGLSREEAREMSDRIAATYQRVKRRMKKRPELAKAVKKAFQRAFSWIEPMMKDEEGELLGPDG
jgi:hypothetical protein